MPKIRIRGDIIRSDTVELSIMKEFRAFGDYSKKVDKTVTAAANDTTTVDMDDIGTAAFVAVFTESPLELTINGSNTDLSLTNFLLMADTEVTSLDLVNNTALSVEVRVIMAA